MKLEIKNLAKVRNAKINIDGIAIITGPNDSGKSTVGKVLDAVFSSLNNLKINMQNSRKSTLFSRIKKVLEESNIAESYVENEKFLWDPFWVDDSSINELVEKIIESKGDYKNTIETLIDEVAEDVFISDIVEKDYYKNNRSDLIETLCGEIIDVMSISDDIFQKKIISNHFNDIFNGNINSIYNDENSIIEITIKDKKIKMEFSKDYCINFSSEIDLDNHSYYIDDPFILDRINNIRRVGLNKSENRLVKSLISSKSLDATDTLQEIIVDNKIQEILNLLNKIIPGKIKLRQKYEYEISEKKSLDIRSLSTGLKSFAIIKRLLELNKLKDKDVLILDEPEIHLHTEWQKQYAELVVLLQKIFDFSIIVTTHSSNFLEAIEFYSKKYSISGKCNYYQAKKYDDGAVEFKDVTDTLESVYLEMLKPSLEIDAEREKMEDSIDNGNL